MKIVARETLPRPEKFQDPRITLKGEQRAEVAVGALTTVWFNTGSLCNITCQGCYMDSGPSNDRLAYLTRSEVGQYLDEIRDSRLPVREIGLTGGEPFMNPDIVPIISDCLARGFQVLVLTNGMKPLANRRRALLAIDQEARRRLVVRVSLDHHQRERHDRLRAAGSFDKALEALRWLSQAGIQVAVAGRTLWREDEASARRGYHDLFQILGLSLDAGDASQLVLFPEMDEHLDVPEITTACWTILGVDPGAMMCASGRMVIKRKGADHPVVVPCTLLPYDRRFELGRRLTDALGPVPLNHPHCARFCVLGGGACGGG